jgi:hypothetical protein
VSPLFATGVIDTGGKFAAGVIDTDRKLPPVSTILAKLIAKFAAGVVDTSGKFAISVVVGILPGIFPSNRDDF